MFAIGCCVRLRLMVELSPAYWSYRRIDARIGSDGICRVAAMGVEGGCGLCGMVLRGSMF